MVTELIQGQRMQAILDMKETVRDLTDLRKGEKMCIRIY